MSYERLTDHVWQVSLPVSTLPPYDHTNGFLVADNGVGMLVDPVCEDVTALDQLRRLLEAAAVRLLKGIVLTHTHPDHVVGLAQVLTAFDCPLYVHAAEAGRLDADLGPVLAIAQDRVLTVGNVTVELLHTPGHSPGHLSLLVRSAPGDVLEAVLAGDLVAADSSIWVGVPEGDVALYLGSLERLIRLQPPLIGAGHGPALREPATRLAELKQHRLEREQQILEVLRASPGGATATAITTTIYGAAAVGVLADLARRSVLAHLAKAEVEGAVSRNQQGDDATFVLAENDPKADEPHEPGS